MLQYISFGSGSSGNCSFLFTETDGLLIDAGVGVRALKKYFKNYGISFDRVKHVLITHDHADHVRAVGSLSKEFGLPVYATHKVHVGIEKNWCVRSKVPVERVKIIEHGVSFHLGEFQITPFAIPHDSSDNVGYCIQHQGATFVLLTDVGHLTDEIKSFIGRANYLVIEADYEREMLDRGPYPERLKDRIRGPLGHMSNEDCAMAIAENATVGLSHVWLCHLSDENNHPDLAEKTVKQILRAHGIVAGNENGADFRLDVLKRKTPSEIFHLL
ncbi:MBL fold metallo-hydrolase [Hallella seregens]|uniref:MBL fold metallo-hydrolase n=1 Tax=Hallella seregens ATCC 51272 TaxID=1336250 RepID=A0ABV5ZH68_9BACT|nr:MBL fold metallo-hydrolase [Hallella seregens]